MFLNFCTMSISTFHVLSVFFCMCASFAKAHVPITVKTDVGSIMGYFENITVDGRTATVSKFLGIPYGESTAGKNRFQKPISKAPFNETFDARNTPLACYQTTVSQMNSLQKDNGVKGFTEDCLTLNIYVPHAMESDNLLPVMIWIHGGGFTLGTASIFNPEALTVFGNVIVVTVNYRLGMFGFLRDTDGNFPGNQGLWDQHLAIKWVHNNIKSFLGYKDEITILGESAGGASVMYQAIYPGNRGLFKRVILESGTALGYWALSNETGTEKYIVDIGCSPNTPNVINCMQSKPASDLHYNYSGEIFTPIIDSDFLVATPREIIFGNTSDTFQARAFYASLDIVVGVNSKEGIVSLLLWPNVVEKKDFTRTVFEKQFVPWMVTNALKVTDDKTAGLLNKLITFKYTDWENPDNVDSIINSSIALWNDALFFSGAYMSADGHAKLGQGNTYLYEFDIETSIHVTPVPRWFSGSTHADEIPYILGLPMLQNVSLFGGPFVTFTEQEKQVSRAIMAMCSNFAKSGDPSIPMEISHYTDLTAWRPYTPETQQYVKIESPVSQTSMKQRFYPERMALWSTIIPEITGQYLVKEKEVDLFHVDPTFVG